ncbi:Oligopeptide ABC transporter, periplasmic oligopeptide-binding protein oppA (TC 3.A.1.5.1) [Hyphomicrobiales bacterium]|nr:Oligopeptide ABC transporter, periplasmic oligopeptide-binding protein oppA (TC 3.A.1.5.1) [Hyphomicrobiales bacterium]
MGGIMDKTWQTLARYLRIGLIAALATGSLAAGASAEVIYRRGNAGDPKTLDQHQTSIDVEANILRDLYDGLLAYDSRGKVTPAAAASWTISPDGKVYTFKLRENGKWSNGDPVKASDFVFSFRRMLDPQTAARYAALHYPIKNARAVNRGELPPAELGVKAIDDSTLEITLEQPTPYFLELLTHQTALPLHQASVEKFGKDFVRAGNLVSNGAFQLTEFVPSDHIKVVKNPNYFDAKDVKVDTVIFYPTEDSAAAVRRFMAGELDTNYQFPIDQLTFLKEKLGGQVRTAPYLSIEYYATNFQKAPFNDPRVRHALSLAIDRDFLAEKTWGGAAVPAYRLTPPGLQNYTPPEIAGAGETQLDREDKAKELLKEAGYGPGLKPLKVEIRYNTNDSNKNTATAVADMWKSALGAEVTLLNSDIKSHYAYLQNKGDFDIARAGWVGDYADPQNFLFLGLSDNAVSNYSRYKNPDYDALLKKTDETGDQAQRMKMLSDAEAMIMKDEPIIPLIYRSSLHLVSPKVTGYEDNVQNVHRSRYISIAP